MPFDVPDVEEIEDNIFIINDDIDNVDDIDNIVDVDDVDNVENYIII